MKEGGAYYENKIIGSEVAKERERHLSVAIVDVIRHGSSDYKELIDESFRLDPSDPEFKLDEEHLDLNQKGIKQILETAEQLATLIDKEKELVILVTSPNFRAHSSAMVLEKTLKGVGVNFLSQNRRIKEMEKLGQMEHRDKKTVKPWAEADQKYRQTSKENISKPPDEAHVDIAAALGKEVTDIFTEDYDQINLRFETFLRHMTNIYKWLDKDTQVKLKDKILRIICLTHEEVPVKFMKKSLNTKKNLENGQLLEIKPLDTMAAGEESLAEVVLYPKSNNSEHGKSTILRKFQL